MDAAFVVPPLCQLASGCQVTEVAGIIPQPGTFPTCLEDSVSLCPAERSWLPLAQGLTPAETLNDNNRSTRQSMVCPKQRSKHGAVWALLQVTPRTSVGVTQPHPWASSVYLRVK